MPDDRTAPVTNESSWPPGREPIVEVRSLVKQFGQVRALDGICLTVAPGTIHALLGPNGAGKTTLVRILTTLLEPDQGTALIAGLDARRDPAGVRARIGLAGQFAAVDDYLTGRENVSMVGRLYGLTGPERARRANDVLDRIRLGNAADRLVKTYSGGMRRRLDLAASLIGRPQVLFLDEPTTGLDPGSRRDIWDLVRDLARDGTTVLLTTQQLEEADHLADRISVIDKGRVISEGTSDDLKAAIGAAMIELRVAEPDRSPAMEALREFDVHGGSDVLAEPGDDPRHADRATPIWLPASEGVFTLQNVLRRLEAVHIVPEDIALRRPTLDEVFLTLTGRPSHSQHTHRSRGRTA